MREKLESILSSYDEITAKLSDQSVLSDQKEYARLAKEHSAMTPLVNQIREYTMVLDGIAEAREILKTESDAGMKDLAKEELEVLEERLESLEDELKVMMLPADPNDDKNVIVEIRAAPAAMRRACSRRTCIGCTRGTPSHSAGRWRR